MTSTAPPVAGTSCHMQLSTQEMLIRLASNNWITIQTFFPYAVSYLNLFNFTQLGSYQMLHYISLLVQSREHGFSPQISWMCKCLKSSPYDPAVKWACLQVWEMLSALSLPSRTTPKLHSSVPDPRLFFFLMDSTFRNSLFPFYG